MHIALVNRWYPPESHGGVAMHNSQFAEACVKLGHRVTVITQSQSGEYKEECINDVYVLRIPKYDLFRYRRIPIFGKQYHFLHILLYSWAANRVLRRVHKVNPVDIVEYADINAEGLFWSGIGRLVVRCHTPSFILAKYYTMSELPYNPVLPSWAEKRVIRRATLVTTPSEDLAEIIKSECQISADKVVTVPNAVDTERFIPCVKFTDQSIITILHVGRMERGKGIDTLVDVIPEVCNQLPNVRFVFVGADRPRADGSSTRRYIEQVLDQQIQAGQVELRGSIPDNGLVATYHEADICVVPSVIYESFSYTVAQAMACGLPVVASRIGGILETLNDGECGILVEPQNSQELGKALVELSNDAQKRRFLGEAGRSRAISLFSSDRVAKMSTEFYGLDRHL